jgi:Na+/proline symporter
VIVAGLLAAYVSTISTHLNWGTSYLVHDCYRRFIRPGREEKHYVAIGRTVTALLMVAAGLFTLVLDTARDSFNLLLSVGAGTGLLYLLRWFWWRINAWSEIAAMISSFVLAAVLFIAGRLGWSVAADWTLIATVIVTTAVWLVATYVTPQTDRRVLQQFYRTVRPAGPGWEPIRREVGGGAPSGELLRDFSGMVTGCVLVYTALFGSGHLLLGNSTLGWTFMIGFVVSCVVLWRIVARTWKA